jgi:hypothetical protein
MNVRRASVFCIAIACGLLTQSVWSQDAATPGPEHKMLKELEGTWDATIKTEGGPSSKGVAVYKMECGDLWLVSDFNGSFGEMKFQGRGLDGYDPEKKKFIAVWIDSMTASPMIFEGTYDAKTKTQTMLGEGKGPDGKPAKYKNVTTTPDKDHQTFKMYLIGPDGKDNLMMTIDYTRRKAK